MADSTEQKLDSLRDAIANEVISYDRDEYDAALSDKDCSTWLDFAKKYGTYNDDDLLDNGEEPFDHRDCWHTAVVQAYAAADRIIALRST